jgi:hypothetical protein
MDLTVMESWSQMEKKWKDLVRQAKGHSGLKCQWKKKKYGPKIVLFEISVEKCCKTRQDTDDNTVLLMHIACRVTKTRKNTDTLLRYVTLIGSSR